MLRRPPSIRKRRTVPSLWAGIAAALLFASFAAPARAANHLAGATSPYLLEHADNPIDWYPWGPQALEKAKREDKPIFLSVGYFSCHWCHVMERESFTDQEIAGLLNEGFVAIKVDREERPDLDALYMNAVIAMARGGGWPMSVFLTPDLRPFHAGTYYPKARFRDLVGSIGIAWRSERARLLEAAGTLRDAMAEIQKTPDEAGEDDPSTDLLALATKALAKDFDAEHGGFGRAPKFPPHGALTLLLRADRQGDAQALRMAAATLEAMRRGGIRDQIGGGFHRYAVDAAWKVPHFEKMLSDNALLAPIYFMAWKQTGYGEFRRVAEETLAFVEREMSDPAGGYVTALDADSDGEEGRYYTFTVDEIRAAVPGKDADLVLEYYGVTPKGSVARGRSVLAPTEKDEAFASRHGLSIQDWFTRLEAARKKLLQARSRRPAPHRDDKVLTAWNGLMITALASAHVATGDAAHLTRARRAADFALKELVGPDGRARVSWRRGRPGGPGFLDDTAFLIRGLLDLNATDPDRRWMQGATALAKDAARFADPSGGWFFAADTPDLIVRPRSLDDSALPAGNAIMVENLARLAHLSGDLGALQEAKRTLDRGAAVMRRAPTAHPYLILARETLKQSRAHGPAADAASAPGLLSRPALAADTGAARAAASPASAPASDAVSAGQAAAGAGATRDVPGQVVGRANRERVVESVLKAPSQPVRPGAAAPLEFVMTIRDGWHTNSSRPTLEYLIPTKVTFTDTGRGAAEGIEYPDGKMVKLQFADEQLSVYEGKIGIRARLRVPPDAPAGPMAFVARLNYQSCSDKACLPPETVEFKGAVEVGGAPLSEAERAAEAPAPPSEGGAGAAAGGPATGATPGGAGSVASAPLKGRDGQDQLSLLLRERGMLFVIGFVFLGGLALCLTPCVYPMIPVTLGYFSQQAEGASWGRRIGLPSLYVLGIAITYSVLGVVVGLTGGLFGSMMQNPIVVGVLILLFVAMAFWMFGVYELRLPGFLTRFGGGRAGAVGAFVMGLTLGLVAAPCVGPFIVTLLAFVAATGSPVIGF